MNQRIISTLDRRLYPQFHSNWDDELFRRHILTRLKPSDVLLDLGAGEGIIRQMDFRGEAAKICGVDPSPRVLDNPFLDDAKVGFGEDIPYDDEVFDVVVSDNVFEHLETPKLVFDEVQRVLKPGGLFISKTPNKNHYVPAIARITPHWFHAFACRWRGRLDEDFFPTYYRANSESDIRSIAQASGLSIQSIDHIEGRPEYLRFSAPSYLIGALYERIVNSTEYLAGLRVVIVVFLQK